MATHLNPPGELAGFLVTLDFWNAGSTLMQSTFSRQQRRWTMSRASNSQEISELLQIQWDLSQTDEYRQMAMAELGHEPTPEEVFIFFTNKYAEQFRIEWQIAQNALVRVFAGVQLGHNPTYREAYEYFDSRFGEEFRKAWLASQSPENRWFAGEALHHYPTGTEAYEHLLKVWADPKPAMERA
jgi:hypothetical protein